MLSQRWQATDMPKKILGKQNFVSRKLVTKSVTKYIRVCGTAQIRKKLSLPW
jgi:hypothetical protein